MAKATTQAQQVPAEIEKPQPGASTALAVVDFGDDAGAGMENVSADEVRIPFLRILDPKSPQCRPAQHGGIPGAVGGSILNTATGEIWDGPAGFIWIPCFRDHNFIEWIPKNEDGSGGGFVGVHAPDEKLVGVLRAKHGRFGKLPMENGNQLAETFYLYGLAMRSLDEPPIRAMIAFASTQIPKYQNFVGRYQNIKYAAPNGGTVLPPLFAHRWRFKTQMDPPKGSMSWFGWNIALDAKDEHGVELRPQASLIGRTDPLYVSAKEFYELIRDGKVAVNYGNAAPVDEADKAKTYDNDPEADIPM